MPGAKVLVLGGTGPSGICLLRELVYRNYGTVVYCRDPSKIPPELAASPLIEIIQGSLDNTEQLSIAASRCAHAISLLGPTTVRLPSPTFFADFYTAKLFPLLLEHGVKNVHVMGTLSIGASDIDVWSWKREAVVWLVWMVAHGPWKNIVAVGKALEAWDAGDGVGRVEWSVFRLGWLLGGSSAEEWERERGGEVLAGGVGQPGWTASIRRAQLARWLVDSAVEGKEGGKWVGKMPCVSSLGQV